MARRIEIVTECVHGQEKSHYLPHEDHQGPHVLQNRYGPDCPDCPGGSRRVLDPGSLPEAVIEAGAKALYDADFPNGGAGPGAIYRTLARACLAAAVDALAGGEQP